MKENQININKVIKLVGVFLSLFLLVSTFAKLKEYRFIGSGLPSGQVITVYGKGEVNRSPDTAKISFSIRANDKQLKSAQKIVSDKVDAITVSLKGLGVEEKYIKTDSYNSYPKYEDVRPCYGAYCPPQNPKIVGYEVSHMVTVNVKDLDKVSDVLGTLGTSGVTDISGPNFGFEDEEAVKREARDMAISDAKAQAQSLAKSLGVKLIRLQSFSESGNYPVPLYGAYAGSMMKDSVAESAPSLPIGEQDIVSSVTLVYEIR